MFNLNAFVRRFRKDGSGSVGIIFGLSLSVLLAVVGGAVEFGRAYATKQRLQNAVDASALAAATMPASTARSAREATALDFFNANTGRVVGATPIVSASDGAVTVYAETEMPTAFLRLANIDSLAVSSSATASAAHSATVGSGGKLCLLALDPAATNGLIAQGTPNITYTGCWAHTNSTSTLAIDGGGSAAVVGAGHSAVGGISSSAPGIYVPAPVANADIVADPFATVGAYVAPASSYAPTFTPPAIPDTCKASNLNLKKGTFALEPGRYCGGIDIKAQATVDFQPGIYIVDDGLFNVQAGASIKGSNVLFYFTGGHSQLTVIGGGTVNMKGRQNGSSYSGFLFIAHPDAARGLTSNIQGGGQFTMEGMLYMPTQNILITGNGDANAASNFFAMVAGSFEFRGNGIFRFKTHDPASNMPDIMPMKQTVQTVSSAVLN